MKTIEELIQNEGFYMTAAQGVSMMPLIRPKADTVVIEKLTEECKPMDIALYRNQAERLVLHRVIQNHECEYVLCGDNCIFPERIAKARVIGKLTAFYHGEKKIELNSMLYRMYVCFWCRPYRFRMFILRIKQRVKRILRKLIYKDL